MTDCSKPVEGSIGRNVSLLIEYECCLSLSLAPNTLFHLYIVIPWATCGTSGSLSTYNNLGVEPAV